MKKLLNILIISVLIFISACNDSKESKGPSSKPIDNGNPFDPNNPTQCLAIDTDGDGVIDCKDPDIDGDGHINEVDAFPYDPTEWKDTDGDGFGDNSDKFPLDPTEWSDFDNDVIGDNADEDDDNDGVPDIFEYFLLDKNSSDWIDVDGDRLGFSIDEDDDNDGCPNIFDDLKYNPSGCFDIDKDLVPNEQDSDLDGDGVPNLVDAFPYDSTEWTDTDLDKVGNNRDPDDDNDGFPDSWEDFPLDKDYLFDTDKDGYANEIDAFPYNPNEWLDSDSDGVGDNSDPFPFNPLEWADTDRDGIGDNSDNDIDNDGFRNCIPLDLNTSATCNQDAFPLDPTEWIDTDGDGVGDNADEDDDNDGIVDVFDYYPKESLFFADFDTDGVPDYQFPRNSTEQALVKVGGVFFETDPDMDNDGCPNVFDDLPFDRFDCFDLDGDKIGDNLDPDKDGDGVPNSIDRFPFDSTEWADTDEDGLGNNIDPDDDNDGVWDIGDVLPGNPNGFSDYDGDGIPDQGNIDIDGDGRINGTYECKESNIYIRGYSKGTIHINNPDKTKCNGSDGYIYPMNSCNIQYNENHIVCSFPKLDLENLGQRADLFPFDANEWQDLDFDGLADNLEDPDDDNDGVWDIGDEFPNDKRALKSYSFSDLDKDGIPDHTLMYNTSTNSWTFVFDPDIDGDGVDDGAFSCVQGTSTPVVISCRFEKRITYQVENPRFGIPEEPEFITAVQLFDAFPYNNAEAYDYDGDGIGDNSDSDADGDGYTNCVPLNLDPSASCNIDQLPLVGPEDLFISSKYYPYDDSNISSVNYCGAPDCFYKSYDRDDDGLTDYEEYLYGSNPLYADTDEDGVPDLIEIQEGTDPDDETSFKDDDGDGIPNFLDKTPKGAFSQDSLREQLYNASTCANKIYQEVCLDTITDLCEWRVSEPIQLVQDPNNPTGPLIPAGKCISKDIVVTQDLELDDCLNISGNISLVGKNRYTIKFLEAVKDGASCSGEGTTAIRVEADATLSLNNIHIESDSIEQLIDSEGIELNITNTSVVLENTKILPGVIRFIQAGIGMLKTMKSTFITKFTGDALPSEDFKPNLDVNLSNLFLESTIFDCNVLDETDYITSSFNCVRTNSNSSTFDFVGSTISGSKLPTGKILQDVNGDPYLNPSFPTRGIYSWTHNSRSSTNFISNIQARSEYLGLKLTGTYGTIPYPVIQVSDYNDVINANDTITSKITLNSNLVNVSNLESRINYGLFTNGIPALSCSEVTMDLSEAPFDTIRVLHPYYYLPTPISPKLSSQVIQTFNEHSVNLSPEGAFETEPQFDIWNNMIGKSFSDFGNLIVSNAVYDIGKARLNALNPTGAGIGRFFNLSSNRKYKIKVLLNAATFDTNIIMDFKVFEGLSGKSIVEGKILPRTNEEQENSYDRELKLHTIYSTYDSDEIEILISPEDDTILTDVGFYIKNSSNIDSNDVFVENIQVLQSVEYNIQYSGIQQPICTY